MLIVFCLSVCLCLSFSAVISAQEEEAATINVTYNVAYGGLLWVNGSAIVNASTVTYQNNTVLLLAATTANANYSYVSMDLNGTVTTNNPVSYSLLVSNETGLFNSTVSVSFVAEVVPTPTPTPDPDALTVDDAVGLSIALPVIIVGVCVALVMVKRKET